MACGLCLAAQEFRGFRAFSWPGCHSHPFDLRLSGQGFREGSIGTEKPRTRQNQTFQPIAPGPEGSNNTTHIASNYKDTLETSSCPEHCVTGFRRLPISCLVEVQLRKQLFHALPGKSCRSKSEGAGRSCLVLICCHVLLKPLAFKLRTS